MRINKKKLAKIVKNFRGKKILIIGDLMLDEYIFGNSRRLSPEAPVPIVQTERVNYLPGGAANAANNVRSLGDETILAGVVGNDEKGKTLIKLLKEKGIKTNGVFKDSRRPTTTKSRIVSQGQHIIRIDKESQRPLSKKLEKELTEFIKRKIKKVDIVLISDYAKGVITPTLSQAVIKSAKKANKRVLVDPKGDDFYQYRGCFMITPNLKELEMALKIKLRNLNELPQAAKMLQALVDSEAVLTTLGENGMALLEKSDKYMTIPSANVRLVDISGAGDTAIASFALSLAAGASFDEAMLISTYACSVVIGKIGTAVVSQSELLETIRQVSLRGDGPRKEIIKSKIRTRREMVSLAQELHTAGKKIVMTGGFFDILHPGHVRYLEKAKRLGDTLIVAVNSDDSTRRNKGPKRPINSQEIRTEILAALEFVDHVTIFNELTPREIIAQVKPHFWVKGGHYKEKEMPEAPIVKKNGGKIKILPLEKDFSVSGLVEKIIREKPFKIRQEGSFVQ